MRRTCILLNAGLGRGGRLLDQHWQFNCDARLSHLLIIGLRLDRECSRVDQREILILAGGCMDVWRRRHQNFSKSENNHE